MLAPLRDIAFEIFAQLGGAVMHLVGGTADIFGSLPDVEIDPVDLGLAHPVGPHDPGAEPLRMLDQQMQRRPLERNARALDPDAHVSKDVVDEALVVRAVDQPVHDVAVGMCGERLDVWRRVHIWLLSSGLDPLQGYVVSQPCGVNGISAIGLGHPAVTLTGC